MQTFLPFPDFEKNAQTLDNRRVLSQLLEIGVILKSLGKQYKPKVRSPDRSGWEGHPVTEMWRFHELRLAEYGLILAMERTRRPAKSYHGGANSRTKSEVLAERRRTVVEWKDKVRLMEDSGAFDRSIFPMWGDEDFHSAFRACLLWKGLEKQTFKNWRAEKYPDHAVTRGLPTRKALWKRKMYEDIWHYFGRPESMRYGAFGWTEEPNPDLVFYRPDRMTLVEQFKDRKRNIKLGVKHPVRGRIHTDIKTRNEGED